MVWTIDAMRLAPELPVPDRRAVPRRRHAMLVLPFYPKDPHGSFGKHVLTPALTMSSIAAATPSEWTVSFWDENLLQGPPPADPLPDVVGITVHLTFARRAYELARWFRSQGSRVVLGGLHVASCPDEAAAHADAIAVGEGTRLWPAILRDADQGCLRPRYDGDYTCPFGDEPLPRREVLDRRDYLTTASLIATRGCRNRCDFCYLATRGVTMPAQVRDPRQVAEDFARCDEPYGVFIDNNLGARPEYLRSLCRELKRLDKIWSAAVTVDLADDEALVRDMAAAGCTGVFVGLETLSRDNLVEAHKHRADPASYGRQIDVFHRHGIQVNGSFVLGFDHDDAGVFDRTIEWIERHRLECATFHILTPYPGTPLFRKLEAEGRILHHDWDLYDTAHVVFRPRLMSAAELQSGYEESYRRLFGHASILRRRPADASEWLPYLAMSYLYKHTNHFWPTVIRNRLTHALWAPLVRMARDRNLARRRRAGRGIEEPLRSIVTDTGCHLLAG
jgi:radical SAM superfamily enzyme YgiQ (UPF0313 family)